MKYTYKTFNKQFPNDDVCLDYIFNQKFGKEYNCPKCHNKKSKFYRVTDRKCFACAWCGYQIHPLAGTIFLKSSTALTTWFYAIFLMSQSKNGVSAKELERQVGVTYKTAWRMAKEIRRLMAQFPNQSGGIFEADETYVGGKGKNNKRGRGAENKTPVFGVVKRQGDVYAKVVANVKSAIVMPILRENVQIGATLNTDEFNIYNQAGKAFKHERVNHGSKEYVRGTVHTNTIEGFWSQLKRSIDGTFHSVSAKHLQKYVDEFAYRYNQRNASLPIFQLLLAEMVR